MAEEQQQGNVRQEFNLGRVGLEMDLTVNQIDKGKLTYALNANLENFDASSVNYQNEQGNSHCLDFPSGYQLIGEHFIQEKNKHIFFLANPLTGGSEIGYMDNNDCIYHTLSTTYPELGVTVKANSPCLNFSINHPIHKAVHKISNCTTEVYWTDGINPRRYIDIEKVPYTSTIGENVCEVVATADLDCNKLKIQPNFSIPELTINSVVNGGELQAGTYQFAVQYCSAMGDAYTSYYSVTNPTPIANPQLTTANYDYAVNKSILIDISNIDVTGYFEYYNLAVIRTINGAAVVQLVGTYFIDGSTNQITYTGQNQTSISLSTADIFEKLPYYDIAEDLTAVQDVLVWDNLTSIDRTNYQKIANKIDLLWETYKIPSTESYADALNATNLRGYMRDEVYAFEIVFLLKNGKQTDGFHIPGRTPTIDDLVTVYKTGANRNYDYIGDGDEAPYWKIYNTASIIGDATGPNIGNATPYQYGNFAYWESTEKYPCNPNVWGNLADQPIRHHKFPDVLVSPIFESGAYTISPDFKPVMQQNSVYPIGVKVSTEQILNLINLSDLTDEQKSEIAGFKIVRGDRSTNRSIVAKGMLRDVGKYTRDTTDGPNSTYYYYANYPYNDLKPDPFLLKKNNAYNSQCVTYKITAGVTSGSIQYTDCYTNEPVSRSFLSNERWNQCSLTVPQVTDGTATIVNITGQSYTLTCLEPGSLFTNTGTIFEYTDPETLLVTTILVRQGSPVNVNSTTLPKRTGGLKKYNIQLNTNYINTYCYPEQLDGFNYFSEPFRYVFNSPETSFGQPTLGSIIRMESAIYGAGRAHFVKVKNNAQYKLISTQAQVDALNSSYNIAKITGTLDATAMFTAFQAYLQLYINGISRRNYAYSFNSVAQYDYSVPIDNGLGVKQRELDICQYLIPGVQSVGDDSNVNNFQRESSVYLKTTTNNFAIPRVPDTPNLIVNGQHTFTDNSRLTVSGGGNCDSPEMQEDITVLSYYGSIKNIFVNQWGQMYSYQTIDTGFQRIFDTYSTSQPDVAFGGDTFIGKFAYKTKLPFFIDNRVNAPDDSDVFYDEIGNIAYPKYWHSSRSILSNYVAGTTLMKNIISVKAHSFDCPNDPSIPAAGLISTTTTSTTFPEGAVTVSTTNAYYDGKFYLFAYGIPYFYVESAINVDLRQAFNSLEGDFYPHVSTGIPDNWLQQTNVPIAFDNTYTYNVTYSRQNTENVFSHLPVDWSPELCYTNYPFRAIYSEQQSSNPSNKVNSWLNYAPVAFFDFPQNFGKLISLDGIQNKAVLARFENKSLLYNTLLTMNTSNPQAAYLGNPTLFRSAPPVDFAETDLGYVGSQNKMLLKIPQGQITVDAKRGQVFLISGNQAADMSAFGSGVNRFMTDHLAFEILNYYPDADTDNHFNGIGIHGVYDSKYDRVIISKLDYIPQVEYRGVIKYDASLDKYYINKQYGETVLRQYIELTDSQYFCNKSWTLSFNMNTKSWVSFHSYIPNFYIAENNFFYSGLNGGCDLTALAIHEVPTPPTTSTTTTIAPSCNLDGTAVFVPGVCEMDGRARPVGPCELEGLAELAGPCALVGEAEIYTGTCALGGEAVYQSPTTTTTSTSSTTTTTTTVNPLCGLEGEAVYIPPTTTTTTTFEPTTTTTTTTSAPISLTVYMNIDSYWACQELPEYTLTVQLSAGATDVCDTTSLTGDFASFGWGYGQVIFVQILGPGYRYFVVQSGGTIAFPGGGCTLCPGITTTTTTTTQSPTTTTTTTTAGPTLYPKLQYDVNSQDCSISNPIEVYTVGIYPDDYYLVPGRGQKYIQAYPHTNFTDQLPGLFSGSCIPPTTTTTTTVGPITTTTTTTCNPAANWTDDGSSFCSGCVAYQPQIDTNPCSPTYNQTRNLNLGATGPCNYIADWTNNGSTFCSGCYVYQPQIDSNPCSSTYNQTRNVNVGTGAPCNYDADWVNNGSPFCSGCTSYQPQVDANPCSSTYTQTRNVSLGQSSPCDYSPNWVNNGANFCSGCVSFEPQIDNNPCSPSYNSTRNVNLGAGAPCDYNQNWVDEGGIVCSGCTTYQLQRQVNPCAADYNTTRNVDMGPGFPCNYSANWVNTGSTCIGYSLYNVQTDTNPCSPTYNTTQLGSVIDYNSPTCGYVPPMPAFTQYWWNDNTYNGGSIEIFVNSVMVVQIIGPGNTGVYSGSYPAYTGDTVSVNINSNGNPYSGTEATLYIENPNGNIIYNYSSATPNPNIPQYQTYTFTQDVSSTINAASNDF